MNQTRLTREEMEKIIKDVPEHYAAKTDLETRLDQIKSLDWAIKEHCTNTLGRQAELLADLDNAIEGFRRCRML